MARIDIPEGEGGDAAQVWLLRPDMAPAVGKMVEAAYHQLCRLWHVRDQQEMGKLVGDLFVKHATWARVRPGPVGGCGGRK